MSVSPIQLDLDFGSQKEAARRHWKANPEQPLGEFLRAFPARATLPLPVGYITQPLKNFQLNPVNCDPDQSVDVTPPGASLAGELRGTLDHLYRTLNNPRRAELGQYPAEISDHEAVQIAYRHELEAIADYLKYGLSVLVVCDKILTEHIYEYVCNLAGKTPKRDDAVPETARQPGDRETINRALQGPSMSNILENIPLLIRSLKKQEVLVLRSLELLDTPALVEALYQNTGSKDPPQLLAFLDPSQEIKKVLTDRFAIRAVLMGLPRYIQPGPQQEGVYSVGLLLTANERHCFDDREFNPEGLYKNVSGLNAVQFRNAMRYVGATVQACSPARKIYDKIRNFKTSSTDEIEIPDTAFEDIGGYEQVKTELKRIVALATGRVSGLDERERQKLIPRGFIFHGPPGTGKTLFAKAIANEMDATIQMVSGPEIMDKYVGQSESNLRHIFATARRNAPSVIFFDEFDSLASQRSTYSDGGSRANNAVVAQLLTELDGFREDQSVMVIGTTNRLDIIDEALLRPSRLKPIEIGLPDVRARRSVAGIHAAKFGVDQLLRHLCQLTLDHLAAWQPGGEIPPAFLDALFEQHPPYKARYEAQGQQADFSRELARFFQLIAKARGATTSDGQTASPPAADGDTLSVLEVHLASVAAKYGFDIAAQSAHPEQPLTLQQSMQADLQDLFALVLAQRRQSTSFSPESFVRAAFDLVAEYTENFNNDEIRAIFQEASLEHHLEGQLITPRLLGLKIGMLRKRRDERQVVHLQTQRSRR